MNASASLLRLASRTSSRTCCKQVCFRRVAKRHVSRTTAITAPAVAAASTSSQDSPESSGSFPAMLFFLAASVAWQQQDQSTATRTTRTEESSKQPRRANLSRFQSINDRGMNKKYTIDWKMVLGEGAYGSVHPARLAATGEKVALKRISRRFTNTQGFKAETQALLRIYDNGGHPNISGLRDMYEDEDYYYLILDLVSGGEMFDHLINFGAYSEADAARLMYEIASALAFMHGVGVVHADLKPENLLLSTKNRWDGTIKVIDFGCAVLEDMEDSPHPDEDEDFKTNARKANSNGTTAYWSPERFDESVFATKAMDMWSVGVILYIMLTGVHPFDPKGISTDQEIEDRIMENPHPPMDKEFVGHLSESATDLIKKLMAKDPGTRITAYDMLHHPWVRGETALKQKMKDSDTKLSQYKDLRYKLQAGIFGMLVEQGHADARISEFKVERKQSKRDENASHILKRAFDVIDADGKGFVNAADLGRVVKEHTGSDVSSRDTQEFLATQSGQEQTTVSALSLSMFNKLFSGLHQRHFPRGHYIFRVGDLGESMYFLSSGKVEIQTRKGQMVAILRSGDFFGEGSLLQEGNRRFTSARCATPVDVLEIPKEDFDRYCGASLKTKQQLNMKWRARSLLYAKNLLRLQKNVKVRTFKKGDVIYKEGDVGTSMYRVDDEDGGELLVSHGDTVVHKYVNGDSFGESSLLYKRPRSSTVTCNSDVCRVVEMKAEDFLAVVESSPEMAKSLKSMALKRLFKRAVKAYSLEIGRGLMNEDIEHVFHQFDVDDNGSLDLDDVTRLMHRMDPDFPEAEIRALLEFVDVSEDGQITMEEFKSLFRQFEVENKNNGK